MSLHLIGHIGFNRRMSRFFRSNLFFIGSAFALALCLNTTSASACNSGPVGHTRPHALDALAGSWAAHDILPPAGEATGNRWADTQKTHFRQMASGNFVGQFFTLPAYLVRRGYKEGDIVYWIKNYHTVQTGFVFEGLYYKKTGTSRKDIAYDFIAHLAYDAQNQDNKLYIRLANDTRTFNWANRPRSAYPTTIVLTCID